jgi:hypothetical protein
MIITIPTADNFKESGIDFLNIAWGIIMDLLILVEDEDKLTDEKYWKIAQRHLSTALSLLQQGAEFLLKGRITNISPYLLLAEPPCNWPKKFSKENINFSEFKSLDAQDLIKVYNTVCPEIDRLPDEFERKYNELRVERNKNVHTFLTESSIDYKKLIIDILEISHHLITSESWIEIRRNYISQRHPSSIIIDPDSFVVELWVEISLVINLLEPHETLKYLNFDKKKRRYICPKCSDNDYYSGEESNLAQFINKEQGCTNLYCMICNQNFVVKRKKCNASDCLGDVLYEKFEEEICLTCEALQ